ncbi:FIG00469370: hypothetical protein [hydrothermal vent metagenome]|uniref:Uncharacterized protein n=1 Tax=hydrothermal vent metagenome TaxID=652676 RepID=A0A1W1B8M6_9ZZZZ
MQRMSETSKELDKFELHLEEMLQRLRECQKAKNFKSCSECMQFLECELRKEYVDAVYNSMSKGDTGGFEF